MNFSILMSFSVRKARSTVMYPKASEYGSKVRNCMRDGQVTVNGETELQRGKKLHDGDVFSYDGETVKVVK